jgi:cell division protein FtsL
MWAFVIMVVGIAWVAKGSWADSVAREELRLEKAERELRIETNNLKRQLMQAAEYAKVEEQAREKLGMEFDRFSPDTIWTNVPTEEPLLGTLALFSFEIKEKPSLRRW